MRQSNRTLEHNEMMFVGFQCQWTLWYKVIDGFQIHGQDSTYALFEGEVGNAQPLIWNPKLQSTLIEIEDEKKTTEEHQNTCGKVSKKETCCFGMTMNKYLTPISPGCWLQFKWDNRDDCWERPPRRDWLFSGLNAFLSWVRCCQSKSCPININSSFMAVEESFSRILEYLY